MDEPQDASSTTILQRAEKSGSEKILFEVVLRAVPEDCSVLTTVLEYRNVLMTA